MKKWSKRVVCMLLAAIMAFSISGCGNGQSAGTTNSEDAKKYVYRMEDIAEDVLSENANITAGCYADGRIYLLTAENMWQEMTGMIVNLVSMKEDGSDVQTVELFNTLRENPDYMPPTDENEGNGDATITPRAEMPVVEPETEPADESGEEATDETTEDGEATVYKDTYINTSYMDANGVYVIAETTAYSYDADGNYTDEGFSLELYSYSLTGEERSRVVLNESREEYMYVNSMDADEKGNVALLTDGKVLLFDMSGAPLSEIDTSSLGYVNSLFIDKEGKLNLIVYNDDWTKMTLKVYNLQANSFEEDVEIPGNLTNYSMNPGTNYDLLLTNSMGIYGYNVGDADVTPIMSYINSDLNSSNINRIFEMGDKKLFGIYNDEETWTTRLAVYTYVDPADIPDKEVLMLACHYLDWNMRKRIVDFNKENEQYRIMVKDYSTYSTSDDWQAGYTQLNNDILAGQIPDILVINDNNMPVSSYIAKGLLADIGKMIEEDEELNMEDYMTNVFDAYSVDGKLYSVIPNFYVSTVIGKTADVGETPGWTMEDLKALMAKYPDSSVFGDSMTRDTMLWQVLMYSGSRFVDRNTGECNFDSPEFIEMLEFVAQFPEEFDWESVGDDYWMTSETQYRTGKTLLMQTSIMNFGDFTYMEQGYFGEPITLIGFPSEEGIGAVIMANSQYAISEKSKNKEGAWEFLRYYLTKDYQMSEDLQWTIPVYKDAVLAHLEEAKERPYWENEDGTKEYYDRTFWLGEEEIIINPLTDEEADELFNYISSVDMAYYFDESLKNIITEEAAALFAGQKSAAEVAEIIQSRAKIYINESR